MSELIDIVKDEVDDDRNRHTAFDLCEEQELVVKRKVAVVVETVEVAVEDCIEFGIRILCVVRKASLDNFKVS